MNENLDETFEDCVQKRHKMCDFTLNSQFPMSPTSQLGMLCGHNTVSISTFKPVWNGFQTISAPWHAISHDDHDDDHDHEKHLLKALCSFASLRFRIITIDWLWFSRSAHNSTI